MIDLDRLRRALVLGALGAISMALLLPPLATLRYTTAHDWYAARKVSVAEALIAVGFDERATTDYRLADGRTVKWLRDDVATYPPARESRSLILAVIGDNILLGASAGFVVLFAVSGLLNLARHEPAGVSREPARGPSPAELRPGFLEEDALPAYQPLRSAPPAPVARGPEPGRTASSGAPEGGSRPDVARPSPGPSAKAESEDAPAPPARPRGRWF